MHHSTKTTRSTARVGQKHYRGTVLLYSAWRRCLGVLPIVLGLWFLTAWALGWLAE